MIRELRDRSGRPNLRARLLAVAVIAGMVIGGAPIVLALLRYVSDVLFGGMFG